jgi:hypothetical protein
VPLILGVGLVCGFILFSATARWGLYNVRYTLPLLVAGSAVIALALARFPVWVGRFVLIGLVVACLPQLLDNLDQPLVPRETYAGSYLAPYFAQYSGTPLFPPATEAFAYQTVSSMLAQSTCSRAAIGNWIYIEYPLWVGLQHDRWQGQLNDFDVHNATGSLEPHYTPCAWMTEQGRHYVTPDNGTVNVQLGNLALSIDPSNASAIHQEVPAMASAVPGVRVLPGAGWSLAFFGHDPLLPGGSGSLYLFSTAARHVQLQLHLVPGVAQPSLAVSDPDGRLASTVVGHDVIRSELDLHGGINRIALTTGQSKAVVGRALALSAVAVDPTGS